MNELKARGMISTTNPSDLTKSDALAIVADMCDRDWKPAYLEEMVNNLRHFVSYCGNPIFDNLTRLKLLPKAPAATIRTLTEEEIQMIRAGAEKIPGWEGKVARFVSATYPGTGLRATELRTARIQDLDTKKWEIRVVNPKGKGRYAMERIVPIHPTAREPILRFLEAREQRLSEYGIPEAEPLMLCIRDGKACYYSDSGLRNIKNAIQQASGVRFKIKDFRSTFAQRTIDLDPTLLSALSKALGHKSTLTTEQFYARIRDSPAIQKLQDAWEKQTSQASPPQSSLIEHKNLLTGYA